MSAVMSQIGTILTRQCRGGCARELPLSMFSGAHPWCRDCWKDYRQRRRCQPKLAQLHQDTAVVLDLIRAHNPDVLERCRITVSRRKVG